MKSKPWLSGLIDNLTAANLIRGTNIGHKNRLILIILDSCLELTFKTYLQYILNIKISEKNLKEKIKDRTELYKLVSAKTKEIFDDEVWKNIKFYYDLRCDLYHEEATKTLSNQTIDDFYELVEFIIDTLFDIRSKDCVKGVEEILKITKEEIKELKKVPINKIKEKINIILVTVKERAPKDAKELQDYLKKSGYRGMIPIGVINKNLKTWYKHLFYFDDTSKTWLLSDEGERRYLEITKDI